MLSKLTFSLAFVVMLAFTLSFLATPAMAQVTAPTEGNFVVATKSTANSGIQGTGTDATATVLVSEQTGMPDLQDLLRLGGTIELSIAVGATGTATADPPTSTVDVDTKAADIMKLKHRLVITEIMWGLDASGDNLAEQTQSQWIEIYNHGGNLLTADDLRLTFSYTKTGRMLGEKVNFDPGDGTAEDRVVLDVVSTVNRFGGSWAAKGNGGNTEPITNPVTPATDLVSMYRKVNLDGANYKVHKDGHLDGLGSGTEAGSWEKSSGRVNLAGRFVGSPGKTHVLGGGLVAKFDKAPASISGTGVIINEVRNDTSEANLDWVELFYNTDDTSATSQNVENWELSIITGKMKADGTYHTSGNANFADTSLAVLPKHKMQPGEYLVVYNRDPGKSVKLAGGINIEKVAAGTQVNKGASHMYVVREGLDLPDDKMFLIILRTRNHNDDVGKPTNVKDYAGNGFFQRIEENKFNTDVWPFVGWTKPGDVEGFGNPTFGSRNMSWGRIAKLNANGEYWSDPSGNRLHKDHWDSFEFVGTGYDRGREGKIVDPQTSPGTPGYPNVAVNVIADDKDTTAAKDDYAFSGTVTISEIMYDAGPRWNLVQWIELYNSSMTETINIEGWELEIRNEATDIETYVDSIIKFASKTRIPPNQTLLVVSSTGTNDVPANYVYNLTENHPTELGVRARGKRLLSNTGFHLTLRAKVNTGGKTEMMVVDEAGNVMVEGAARLHEWDLPEDDPSGIRKSIVRVYGTREIDGTPDDAEDGTMASSWKQSDLAGAGLTFYGHRNDISTPGYRLGGPLPVSLSSFRPVRNDQTGHVDITWVTESELNNAGFNILRSDSKDGAFKVVNVKGIVAGHGTTSEKHVYTYTDTTAKPNVVYYYQIEDVSLDGNRTTLATTHLRGNVSAAGKLTTTWGDLKTQQ